MTPGKNHKGSQSHQNISVLNATDTGTKIINIAGSIQISVAKIPI